VASEANYLAHPILIGPLLAQRGRWEADAAASAGRTVAVGSALSPQEIAGARGLLDELSRRGPSDIGGVPLT
jgi:hypothetical protein